MNLKYHRQGRRQPSHDYSLGGRYFITICTFERQLIFGEVIDKTVQLSSLGRLVDQCWSSLPSHAAAIRLLPYVIMPNHLHALLEVPRHDTRPLSAPEQPEDMMFRLKPRSLGTAIRSFKSASTRLAREQGYPKQVPLLQNNLHDRAIRSEEEYQRCVAYIENNPLVWDPEEHSSDADMWP
jgi:REP element-mobilizing transposase RayT